MKRKISEEKMIKLFKIRNEISKLNNSGVFLNIYDEIPIDANSTYVKYTNKNSMYKMLESDSLFMFCSELSNDKTENKMLDVKKTTDTYVSCFYNGNNGRNNFTNCSDILSQWMSYCPSGGASFEFYFGQDLLGSLRCSKEFGENYDDCITTFFDEISHAEKNQFGYSLLLNNAKDESDFVFYPNFPFHMQYYENTINDSDSVSLAFKSIYKKYKLENYYILPYLKHSGFVQESESRLAFVNDADCLSDCIKFIPAKDGTRIPYIEVKFGNADLSKSPCEFVIPRKDETLEKAVERKLKERSVFKNFSKFPIIIPQGRDQEEVFNIVEKTVNNLSPNSSQIMKPKIICQGHLPITKITLAPTEDRFEQKKMMEIFCKSKYWLRNVEIVESKIPYNTKNANHI